MPLQIPYSTESYTRVSRIFVDTSESQGTISDYRYTMKNEIQDVFAIELTSFAVPSSLTPTFLPGLNDSCDFSVSAGALTKNFSFTWPSQSYVYVNMDVPYLSYVNALAQLLVETLYQDPDFGNLAPNQVFFNVVVDPEEKTHMVITGTGVTGFSFLFGSGPNASTNCSTAMGFTANTDTASALTLISPNPVLLEPFSRVEIFIDEFPELRPVHVIYNTNSAYYGTTYNETNISRTYFLKQPVRKLTHLTIRVRINGRPVLNDEQNAHSLTFTVFSVASEETVPKWLNQFFIL